MNDDDEDLIGSADRWETYRQPVTVDFLSKVFRMSRDSVRKKLGSCREVAPKKYDFVEAASWLVQPRYSVEDYVRVLKQGDLPPRLQDAMWRALRTQQLWEQDAGDLWRTEKVIEVFGEVFKRIKMVVQLFADSVDRESELTVKQRQIVVRLSDGLLADMHAELAWMADNRSTMPLLGEDVVPQESVDPEI